MTGDRADEWDADRYDDQCEFVYEYGADVTDLLDLDRCERLLDLGCGTGQLSRRIAERGVRVVGVDNSPEMVSRARERHGDVDGLRFVHADARNLSALDCEPFDAVFSNAALHWIPAPDHDAVLAGVARVLRPDGAFVAELGGRGNVARIVNAVRAELDDRGYTVETPWYFPSVGEYATRLEAHDLEVRQAHLFHRPTTLENGDAGLHEWLAMFGDDLFRAVPDEEYESAVAGVEERLREDLFDGEAWTADYRRLRFRAVNVA